MERRERLSRRWLLGATVGLLSTGSVGRSPAAAADAPAAGSAAAGSAAAGSIGTDEPGGYVPGDHEPDVDDVWIQSHAVQAGERYFSGASVCTTGFTVDRGFVTVGHCGSVGTTVADHDRLALGTVAGSIFPGRDMGWVQVIAGRELLPRVNRYHGWVPVRGARPAGPDETVCVSSPENGWRCGRIVARNVTVQFPGWGLLTGLIKTDITVVPASGAPLITDGTWQAQGVLVGAPGGGSGTGSYFQPILPILSQFGLQLRVSAS